MTPEKILLRYLHFISIFAIVGSLVSEHLLLKKELTRAEIVRISRIDAVYGKAALTLLGVGLTLWLGGFGKPTAFIVRTGSFILKSLAFSSSDCYQFTRPYFSSETVKEIHPK